MKNQVEKPVSLENYPIGEIWTSELEESTFAQSPSKDSESIKVQ